MPIKYPLQYRDNAINICKMCAFTVSCFRHATISIADFIIGLLQIHVDVVLCYSLHNVHRGPYKYATFVLFK